MHLLYFLSEEEGEMRKSVNPLVSMAKTDAPF